MKLILWAVAEEVAFKAEKEVITEEEADMDAEEDLMAEMEKEADMAEEPGKNQNKNGPDPMPEWYSVTIARR